MLNVSEHGRYLALDLGGTNFRVLLVTLKGRETPEVISKLFLIPTRVMVGSGQQASVMHLVASLMSSFRHCIQNYRTWNRMQSLPALDAAYRIVHLVKDLTGSSFSSLIYR